MNIKVPVVVTRKIGRAGLALKKWSPEIMMVVGVGGLVTAAVMASKRSRKFDEKMRLEEVKRDIDAIHKINVSKKAIEDGTYDAHEASVTVPEDHYISKDLVNAYSWKDNARDLCRTYGVVAGRFVKLYGAPIALATASIGMIFGSNVILENRNAALATAYSALQATYNEYRRRISEKYGEETDQAILFNEHKEKVSEKFVDPVSGKEKTLWKTMDVITEADLPDNAIIFDKEHCTSWEPFPDYNETVLFGFECAFNDILRTAGKLFENDVRKRLGAKLTTRGQHFGWALDGKGAGYVSFCGDTDGRRRDPSRPEYIVKRFSDGKGGWEKKIVIILNSDPEPLDCKLDFFNKLDARKKVLANA